jgi:hypothetical protein
MTTEDEPPRGLGDTTTAGPNPTRVVEALSSRSFEVHCPVVTLTQCQEVNPEIIRGRGSIRLLGRTDFEISLHADAGTDPMVDINRLMKQTSGTFVADTEYYALKATDYDGVEWCAERVLVKREGWGPVFVTGVFPELKNRTKGPTMDNSYVTLIFFGDPGLRYNQYIRTETMIGDEADKELYLAAVGFEDRGFSIRVRPMNVKEDAIKVIVDVSKGVEVRNIEQRVTEALSYVLCRPVHWSLCLKEQSGQRELILTPRKTHGARTIHSPIGPHPTWAKDFWQLFSAYLRHIVDHPSPDPFHYSPLATQLRPLISGESDELVVIALLVTVAVEGVLHLEFPQFGKPTSVFVGCLERAQEVLRRMKGMEDGFRNRAGGALSAMKEARARDKLIALRDMKVLTEEMIGAWTGLRNASAHATIDPKSFDNQRLWNQCNTVATMLHLLVFTAIGYSGRYLDFSVEGWPEKEFVPPTLRSSETPAEGAPTKTEYSQ